jgi:hypothetical protein
MLTISSITTKLTINLLAKKQTNDQQYLNYSRSSMASDKIKNNARKRQQMDLRVATGLLYARGGLR